MTSDDPWHDLAPPLKAATVNARRIDDTNQWDFFWGRDSDGRCLLILRHGVGSSPTDRLPRLKGVEVFLHTISAKEKPSLVLRLLDASLRDIFHRLCLDIVASASGAATETEAVAIALARTWRWHHLLRGGSSGLLSTDEQKGLIGELFVMERYLLTSLGPSNGLAAWRGPLGGAKDFVVGRTAIESKVRATSDRANVFVSSEFQLDDSDVAALFLHVSVLDPAPAADDQGFTVTDVAVRLRKPFAESDERLAARFDALLAAAGFWYSDDYVHARWVSGGQSIYRVAGNFPRLTPSTVPASIATVSYTVSLAACGHFLATPKDLEQALTGTHNDS